MRIIPPGERFGEHRRARHRTRLSGLLATGLDLGLGRVHYPTSPSLGGGFKRFGGVTGQFLCAFHGRADTFDLQLAGGDLARRFAVLVGMLQCPGMTEQHAPEDGHGAVKRPRFDAVPV
jgi:hypothetical protein